VIAAIAFFVIRSCGEIGPEGKIISNENQFRPIIEKEIDQLSKMPDSKFCKADYDLLVFHINEYHKTKKLGSTPSENNINKTNLSGQAYAVYADKFIQQAFYIFNHAEWNPADLNFIRAENLRLKSSSLLGSGSTVSKKFSEIDNILKKHDEISAFISSCKKFSSYKTGLVDLFPIAQVNGMISQAAAYRSSGLGNSYVNNCSRFQDGLKNIPKDLFFAHTKYLDSKINYWSGMYVNYGSFKTYADNVYKPLKQEIDQLDNSIYKVSNFEGEKNLLKAKWQKDADKAYINFDK
jgi:hypothetical protein